MIQLFCISLVPSGAATVPGIASISGLELVRMGDLAAIARPRTAPGPVGAPSEDDVTEHQRVIEAVFHHTAVLPAPPGTMFRSTDAIRRWLAQNEMSIGEGLHYVAGRCEARVHLTAAGDAERSERLIALADDCLRQLRRAAAATLPLRSANGRVVRSGGFLVALEDWSSFSTMVQEQVRRCPGLEAEETGPWPPYDFVRLDFGD